MFIDMEGLFLVSKGFKCGNHNPGFGDDMYENWKGGERGASIWIWIIRNDKVIINIWELNIHSL